MKYEGRILFAAFGVLLVAGGFAASQAAEVHLRGECRCAGALVTLGDVADIYSNSEIEKAELSRVELFPAPAEGSSRSVRLREIQDILAQRGVDLRRCRLGGASTVQIIKAAVQNSNTAAPGPSVKQQVESRIASYLTTVDSFADWQVTANVTGDLQRALASGKRITNVTGGREPWVGSQRFTVTVADGNATQELPVVTNVQRPLAVVVPVRPLSRGRVVQASDVQVQSITSSANYANAIECVEQAIGQEDTRTLSAGRPLSRGDIRPAVLVTKNSIVTVFARSPGIQVRTSAKALEDGARDDVIKLQSLEDRNEQFVARVTAHKEVEILAGSPRIEPSVQRNSTMNTNARPHDTNRLGTTQRPSVFGLRVAPN